jgi:hypothetical protein
MVSHSAGAPRPTMPRSPAIGLLLRRQRPTQVRVPGVPGHACVESDVDPVPWPGSSEVVAVPVGKPHDRLVGVGPATQPWTQKGQRRPRGRHSVGQSCSHFCIPSRVAGWSSADQRTFPNRCWSVVSRAHRNSETNPTNGYERFDRYVKPRPCPVRPSQSAGPRYPDSRLLAHQPQPP